MRPPECAICGKEFEPGEKGGVIYFKKRFSDQVWERKMKRINGVGHPPYAEWFCENHYERADELRNLSIDKAMAILREKE
ncbi:MAG TPA: hypothetical protein VMX17_16535 [Candidatus Glassbacteria bacterium]|nr:hypothetical protein [Candidatus Glassbacteria bacterium]